MILIRFSKLAGLKTYTSPPTPLQRRGASSPTWKLSGAEVLEGVGEVFAMTAIIYNFGNLFNLNKIAVQNQTQFTAQDHTRFAQTGGRTRCVSALTSPLL